MEDIKKVAAKENYSFTHNEIVNCIKASSMGNSNSGIEPKSSNSLVSMSQKHLLLKSSAEESITPSL